MRVFYVLSFISVARSNQGDDEKWWVSVLLFLGIYVVLVGDT